MDRETSWHEAGGKLMRILVTGVSGQVGGALASRLEQHDIVAADRSALDLSRSGEIAETLDRLKPELIINSAAFTAVDLAESQQELAKRINTAAPEAIAGWGATHDVPVIYFSTDYIFDGSGEAPWSEDDPAAPLSVYGKTKHDGELAVRAAGGAFLIIRLCWVYSAAGKNFMRTIAKLAQQRDMLRVVADQIGAPTSAKQIAEAVTQMVGEDIELLCERCARSRGLVHLAASGETSWHGFACAVIGGLRAREVHLNVEEVVPISTSEYPTPAKRPNNSRLELTRLAMVFGIRPAEWPAPLNRELDLLAAEMRDNFARG